MKMHAEFIRIKFGSNEDAQSSFLILDKGDGKQHVRLRHGDQNRRPSGAGVAGCEGRKRLNYKLKVAIAGNQGENNEVIISVRQHASLFPMVGFFSNKGYQLFSLSTKAKVGTLQDNETLTPV